MPSEAFLQKAIRFALTGILITGIHVVVAFLSVQYLAFPPAVANAVAFATATICSYLINTTWSFSSRLERANLYRFIAVSSVGLFLAVAVSAFVDQMGLHYGIGIFAVALTVPPVTFLLHNYWTYR
jgi:putative flippase GtrA